MTAERDRIKRKAAAFETLLDNIATVRRPDGGDPEVAERAARALDRQPRRSKTAVESDDSAAPG